MTDAKSTGWPFTVQAAYVGLTLQMAFGLIGLAVGFGGAPAMMLPQFWGLVAVAAVILGLTGWVMARFPRRERRVRWGAAALQAVLIAGWLVVEWADAKLGTLSFLSLNVLIPTFVVAMLFTPAAARWFDR